MPIQRSASAAMSYVSKLLERCKITGAARNVECVAVIDFVQLALRLQRIARVRHTESECRWPQLHTRPLLARIAGRRCRVTRQSPVYALGIDDDIYPDAPGCVPAIAPRIVEADQASLHIQRGNALSNTLTDSRSCQLCSSSALTGSGRTIVRSSAIRGKSASGQPGRRTMVALDWFIHSLSLHSRNAFLWFLVTVEVTYRESERAASPRLRVERHARFPEEAARNFEAAHSRRSVTGTDRSHCREASSDNRVME